MYYVLLIDDVISLQFVEAQLRISPIIDLVIARINGKVFHLTMCFRIRVLLQAKGLWLE